MDERIKAYEDKNEQILRQPVKGVSVRSAQAVPIPMYWTRSPWTTTEHRPRLQQVGNITVPEAQDADDPALGEKA